MALENRSRVVKLIDDQAMVVVNFFYKLYFKNDLSH
jgi:hypothetical protein